MGRCAFPTRTRLMALVGDPLEPRFRMMAGTAQAGDTLSSGAAFFLKSCVTAIVLCHRPICRLTHSRRSGDTCKFADRTSLRTTAPEVVDRRGLPFAQPEAPTQSPAVIAGLRSIATSLWLRSVASPQRMPITRYRRWGRLVVNVIYRVPPSRRFLRHRQYSYPRTAGAPACTVFFMRYRIQPAMSHLREPIYESTNRTISISSLR